MRTLSKEYPTLPCLEGEARGCSEGFGVGKKGMRRRMKDQGNIYRGDNF